MFAVMRSTNYPGRSSIIETPAPALPSMPVRTAPVFIDPEPPYIAVNTF